MFCVVVWHAWVGLGDECMFGMFGVYGIGDRGLVESAVHMWDVGRGCLGMLKDDVHLGWCSRSGVKPQRWLT